MANSGSKKQIAFDLCQESLKKYYPLSYTQAYYEIRRFTAVRALLTACLTAAQ